MSQSQRTVYIFGHITDQTLSVIPQLHELDKTKGEIRIVLSSPGGEDYVGYAIYDCIKSLKNKVTIYGMGEVCSIATIIFLASGNRGLSKNTVLMIHNGSLVMGGGSPQIAMDEINKLSRHCDRTNEKYYSLINGETGIPVPIIRKWCAEERYFEAAEALANGFATYVR